MERPSITIHNAKTGEVIVREMTDSEFSELQAERAKSENEARIRAEAEAQRVAIINRLGLTKEEVELLLS